MTKPTHIVITEEQAVQFEAAGIPVEVQYTVRTEHLLKPAAHPVTTAPTIKNVKPHRTIVYGTNAKLRWTGLSWSGGASNTQGKVAYNILHDHFSARDCKTKVLPRRALNQILAKEMAKLGLTFNPNLITHLCEQKYLELASDGQQQLPGL